MSTIALVVLRPASAADQRAARAAAAPPAVQASAPAERTEPVVTAATAPRYAPAPRPASAPRNRAADRPALQAVPATAADADPDTAALAQALVGAGATSKPVEQVRQVLAAHAAGCSVTRIAADTRLHHATVRKLINAATQQRQLVTVG